MLPSKEEMPFNGQAHPVLEVTRQIFEGNEAVFFQVLEEKTEAFVQRIYPGAKILLKFLSYLLDRVFPVTKAPYEGSHFIEIDFVVRLFQPGKKVFDQHRMRVFRFEEDKKSVFALNAPNILGWNQVEKVDLGGPELCPFHNRKIPVISGIKPLFLCSPGRILWRLRIFYTGSR